MASGTKVQLRLGERVVAEVSFEGAEMRIGRMKENDLVINNLAVSRFHAVLRRVGDAFEIEDLGSENGTLVDGVSIAGSAVIPEGAAIMIGKHSLSLRAGGDGNTQPPIPRKSDVWDAAQTYFVAGMVPEGDDEAVAPVVEEAEAVAEEDVVAVAEEAVEEGAVAMGVEEDAVAMGVEEDAVAMGVEEDAVAMGVEEGAVAMGVEEDAVAMGVEEVVEEAAAVGGVDEVVEESVAVAEEAVDAEWVGEDLSSPVDAIEEPVLAPEAEDVAQPEPMAPMHLDPVDSTSAPEMPSDLVVAETESVPQQLEMPEPAYDAVSSDEALGFGEEELVGGAMPDPVAAEAPNSVVEAEEIPALLPQPALEIESPSKDAGVASAGQTALFDFGLTDDLGLSDRSLAVVQTESGAEAPATAAVESAPETLHADLIVERGGRVERVVAWDAAELVVGRAPECELVLGGSGVSRRHAELRNEGGTHAVRDLGSANGIYVNGIRVEQVELEQGDVIRIDDFTLTFVLDREPVAESVRGRAGSAPRSVASAEAVPMPERDLVLAEDADLEAVAADKQLEVSASEAAAASDSEEPLVWAFEVAIATERLPEELRRALEEMDAAELVLPAQLRLVRRNPA